MREDRWLAPEDPANRLQYAVVPFFVEIDRYLGRYTNEHLYVLRANCYLSWLFQSLHESVAYFFQLFSYK